MYKLKKERNIDLNIDGEELAISKDDVEIISHEITGWVVESEDGITVAIDTELDNELIEEGLAREFVNRIQNMRKDAGFDVTDKIKINFTGCENFVKAIKHFKNIFQLKLLQKN